MFCLFASRGQTFREKNREIRFFWVKRNDLDFFSNQKSFLAKSHFFVQRVSVIVSHSLFFKHTHTHKHTYCACTHAHKEPRAHTHTHILSHSFLLDLISPKFLNVSFFSLSREITDDDWDSNQAKTKLKNHSGRKPDIFSRKQGLK